MTDKIEKSKRIIPLFCVIVALIFWGISVKAEESAQFHVQTAEDMGDGTIRVSVYLNGITDLGGVEAELYYDPQKVSYVSSGIGNSFTDGIGVTNHVESDSMVKCVLAYTSSKNANGEMMYVVFKVNVNSSYQPKLVIKNVVDSSAEIVSVPYTVQYQQSNGSWSDSEDLSGEKADQTVIEQAKKEYAAKADQKERQDVEGASTEAGKLENGDTSVTERSKETGEQSKENESETAEKKEQTQEEKKKTEPKTVKSVQASDKEKEKRKSTGRYGLWIAVGSFAVVCLVGVMLLRRKRK